jgi:NAD(P)-dependent dehydrogenase (short-subunit alcohol dehydrogenase family)
MSRVAVITGGAGGMGLATERIVGGDHAVVLCDVRADRLDAATAGLQHAGVDVTAVHADVTDREAVTALYETAARSGPSHR